MMSLDCSQENCTKREALPFSSRLYKESEYMLELEENMKTIKSAKEKLQELGDSL